MSRELETLVKRASQKHISDPRHIEKIMKYLLARPLWTIQEDPNYKFLTEDLTDGFNLIPDSLETLMLKDILILIGKTQGNKAFAPPELGTEGRMVKRNFNSAGSRFYLASMLQSRRRKNPRIEEFFHIQAFGFIKYLERKSVREWDMGLIHPDVWRRKTQIRRTFQSKVDDLIRFYSPGNYTKDTTLGHIITIALSGISKGWICSHMSLSQYARRTILCFDILNSLFMDLIRTSLIPPGDQRFSEIIAQYGKDDDQ